MDELQHAVRQAHVRLNLRRHVHDRSVDLRLQKWLQQREQRRLPHQSCGLKLQAHDRSGHANDHQRCEAETEAEDDEPQHRRGATQEGHIGLPAASRNAKHRRRRLRFAGHRRRLRHRNLWQRYRVRGQGGNHAENPETHEADVQLRRSEDHRRTVQAANQIHHEDVSEHVRRRPLREMLHCDDARARGLHTGGVVAVTPALAEYQQDQLQYWNQYSKQHQKRRADDGPLVP
mmetsp:Transcript_79805/g.222158  ORF Transcript_79805/g.222158 Transcript_79805/m.222158 type:complete len:232 (+) Transcript_79805:583-1278(+)